MEKNRRINEKQTMKKAIKILAIFLASTIILVIITAFIVYFNISHKWENFYTKTEMRNIALEINNSQHLNKKYYDIYDIIFPKKRKSTIICMFINFGNDIIFGNKSTYPSPYIDIYNILVSQKKIKSIDFKKNIRKPSLIFGFGISKYTTPQKCFDYMHNANKIDELSMNLFQKKYEELDNSQMLEVVLKFEYPQFKNNQIKFKKKYNLYYSKIK